MQTLICDAAVADFVDKGGEAAGRQKLGRRRTTGTTSHCLFVRLSSFICRRSEGRSRQRSSETSNKKNRGMISRFVTL